MKPFTEDLRYEYSDLTPESVVIDLGCYEADFAVKIHGKYGCWVYAFEPVPHFFERCYNHVHGKYPKIKVYNFAVSNGTGPVMGIVHGDMSGLYAQDGSSFSANMITMDEALEIIEEQEISLAKINIEGSEFPLLEDMVKKGLIPKFKNLQIQWHGVVPNAQERYDALQAELAKTHEKTFDHGWIWQNWHLKS